MAELDLGFRSGLASPRARGRTRDPLFEPGQQAIRQPKRKRARIARNALGFKRPPRSLSLLCAYPKAIQALLLVALEGVSEVKRQLAIHAQHFYRAIDR